DGASTGTVDTYFFGNVKADHTIAATFLPVASTPLSYTITASVKNTGGSITPSGAVTVNPGYNKTFNIAAEAGYRITDVRVDGAPVGIVDAYTFNNVSADHTIEASFSNSDSVPVSYTITASVGGE